MLKTPRFSRFSKSSGNPEIPHSHIILHPNKFKKAQKIWIWNLSLPTKCCLLVSWPWCLSTGDLFWSVIVPATQNERPRTIDQPPKITQNCWELTERKIDQRSQTSPERKRTFEQDFAPSSLKPLCRNTNASISERKARCWIIEYRPQFLSKTPIPWQLSTSNFTGRFLRVYSSH